MSPHAHTHVLPGSQLSPNGAAPLAEPPPEKTLLSVTVPKEFHFNANAPPKAAASSSSCSRADSDAPQRRKPVSGDVRRLLACLLAALRSVPGGRSFSDSPLTQTGASPGNRLCFLGQNSRRHGAAAVQLVEGHQDNGGGDVHLCPHGPADPAVPETDSGALPPAQPQGSGAR